MPEFHDYLLFKLEAILAEANLLGESGTGAAHGQSDSKRGKVMDRNRTTGKQGRFRMSERGLAALALALMLTVQPALAQNGTVLQTPVTPMELPVEVEIELSPAGSLKQAPLWKELVQLLQNPHSIVCPPDDPTTELTDESNYCTAPGIQRRPGFGSAMPALNVYSLAYNFLTGQPLRYRTSDGEISWDQPGPLFDPDEVVAVDAYNTPTELRTVIGHLVACPNVDNPATPNVNESYQAAAVPGNFCNGKPDGSLVVHNPDGNAEIPPDGTVVAEAATRVQGGQLRLVDPETGSTVSPGQAGDLFEIPINEEDFFKPNGRAWAEVLGKAFFWDMQVGSDGVQACASCHFHAGVDNRTRNQLNPNHLSGDTDYEVASVAGSLTSNVEVLASDFPFHNSVQDDLTTANDVMSSMGVSQFELFVDIPVPGAAAFLPPVNGVAALAPDIGNPVPDPIPIMQGVRRIEPRHTPTFQGAAFNFDNFWDGRARFNFNGGSVFGPSDPTAHIFIREGGTIVGATNGHIRPDLVAEDPEVAEQPVRIKFSSLASQAVGPPLSEFEMSFFGRNHAKIGKKLLQAGVTPLANQLVATDDSRLGPYSNQGGSYCTANGLPTAPGKPGLCISYPTLIQNAFKAEFWNVNNRHLNGAPCADPFDGYCLTVANGAANPADTNEFTQMEANFSLFFGLSIQAYEELTIPDHTPADQFFDVNPHAGHAVGEPGDQAVLFPTLVPDLVDDGQLNGTFGGTVTLVP
ncbi:MAG: hypothetical protein ACFE9C_17395, partial [Candidatus Hodarchaeota archaeon]